jgi:NAD+ kinase
MPAERAEPTVGVATDAVDAAASTVTDAVAAAGATADAAPAAALADRDPAFVVAHGEPALLAVLRAGVDAPVLPVAAGRGVRSVPKDALHDAIADAVDAHREDALATVARATLAVDSSTNGPAVAAFDVQLVTTEPARISEYAVATAETPVAQFRADGVVVATPAGTHGYAGNAGAPLLAPGSRHVAVVPLAPFVTDSQQWVLDDDGLTLRVARDEGDVSLLVDDRDRGVVPPDVAVTVSRGDPFEVVVVPDSQPVWPP